MRLENWSVSSSDSPYLPPEQRTMVIHGDVYGNPKWENGHRIRTSRVQKVEGNKITTLNSVYELGEPDPLFVKWCVDNRLHVPTKEEPIKAFKNVSS